LRLETSRGAEKSAEIIPIEPDAGNAAQGDDYKSTNGDTPIASVSNVAVGVFSILDTFKEVFP